MCKYCEGTGLVCETHQHLKWGNGIGECECSPGMPCLCKTDDVMFSWPVTSREYMRFKRNSLVGMAVFYEPTGSVGVIIEIDGEIYFKFEDMDNPILFDSKEGSHTLKNCIPE